MTKKNILERIVSNAMTRVGTNMLARALQPAKPAALRAMPPVPKNPPVKPKGTYYLNTAKGFVVKKPGRTMNHTFTPDMRNATPFPTFSHADDFGKAMVKQMIPAQRYFAIVQPA